MRKDERKKDEKTTDIRDWPEPQELQKLRRGTMRNFKFFAEKLLPEVTGKAKDGWKNHMFVCRVSENPNGWGDPREKGDCVSVSDEALVLFLYENNFEKWKRKRANGWLPGSGKGEKEDGKYSTVSRRRKFRNGWGPGAMDRFTELHQLVKEDRESEAALKMETWFLKKMRRSNNGREYLRKLKGKTKMEEEESLGEQRKDGPVASDLPGRCDR